ncbi:MAG: O-antigen ligase family protein [Clostridia bacterium]|nr:O-antigen ligase family protein [Clostridia bacterium]
MKKFKVEKLLYILIILCPILDMTSFIFRNTFNTNISPSTFVRPIIPIIVIIYIFIKDKNRWKIFGVGVIYGIYALVHIYLFSKIHNGSSYGGVVHEAQYIINYTFMILNLFLYMYMFKNNNIELKKGIIISSTIYITSIWFAIATGTSSTTYIEGIGYKGWFESGNSLSAILILSLFILLPLLKKKKAIIVTLPLIGIYLTTQIGTRVGLYGFILVVALYVFIEFMYNLIHKKKINKKFIVAFLFLITILAISILVLGSNTLARRRHIKQESMKSYDETNEEIAHLTGDVIRIKEAIEQDNLPNGYLSEPEKKAFIELYNIANEKQFSSNNQRLHQLVYNIFLVKEQKSLPLILFGNGYENNFRELVLEMELVSFILNFGILGFLLYIGPFIAIMFYSLKNIIKYFRRLDVETIMLFLGSGFAYVLSLCSGYVFFNSSSMMIVIILHTCLVSNIIRMKEK